MTRDASQREILAGLRWPDPRRRLEEEAQAVQSLTPTERLHRVAALRRVCLELAASAGNLEAAQRYYDWRESQWRERIRQAVRLYERKRAAHP
jgi:hypothetical protein